MGVADKRSSTLSDAIDVVKVRVLPDGRMDRDNAARYHGHQPKTLAMWALNSKGPRSVKVGGRVFYFKEVLDGFVRGDPTAAL
jgi:hypothetical protein